VLKVVVEAGTSAFADKPMRDGQSKDNIRLQIVTSFESIADNEEVGLPALLHLESPRKACVLGCWCIV